MSDDKPAGREIPIVDDDGKPTPEFQEWARWVLEQLPAQRPKFRHGERPARPRTSKTKTSKGSQ